MLLPSPTSESLLAISAWIISNDVSHHEEPPSCIEHWPAGLTDDTYTAAPRSEVPSSNRELEEHSGVGLELATFDRLLEESSGKGHEQAPLDRWLEEKVREGYEAFLQLRYQDPELCRCVVVHDEVGEAIYGPQPEPWDKSML